MGTMTGSPDAVSECASSLAPLSSNIQSLLNELSRSL